MRLVGVSMVRDESDVIESFVRYHVRLLDHLVVVDHRSSDGTSEILAALAGEGLPLTVTREPSFGHPQAARLTEKMKSAVHRHGADWVVLLDADEFLQSRDGAGVRAALEAHAEGEHYLRVPWRTYVPTAEDDAAEPDVLKRVRQRCASEPRQWYKALPPRRIAGARRALLPQGSHDLYRGRLRRAQRYPFRETRALELAHFPLRSVAQMERKIVQGWLASRALPPERRPENWHWGVLFRALARGERMDASKLSETARRYPSLLDATIEPTPADLVRDPVAPEKEADRLRYLELRRPPSLTGLLSTLAEELADDVGRRTATRPRVGFRRASAVVPGAERRRRAGRGGAR